MASRVRVGYIGGMRYADGGGLDARGRAHRQAVRMQAADLFEERVPAQRVAVRLRVARKSAYQWQQVWRRHGRAGLVSAGPSGTDCRLNPGQLARLQQALDEGPAAHGWSEDQRWTLPRVAALIAGLFHVCYTDRGVGYLLHRLGWSPQVPVHRAAERDEAAIAAWRQVTWLRVRRWPASCAGGSVSRMRPGSR